MRVKCESGGEVGRESEWESQEGRNGKRESDGTSGV